MFPPLQLLNFYAKPTGVANLLRVSLSVFLSWSKTMLMFRILPPLPYTFLRPSPKVLQALFKLLVLLLLLLFSPPFPFCIQGLRTTPLLPGKFFDLIPEEEHHVGVRRFVRVGFEEVGKKLLISEFRYISSQLREMSAESKRTHDL